MFLMIRVGIPNIFVYNGGANTKDHWVINIRVGSS